MQLQIEYKKQKQEVVNQYRGYQTLDTQDHPVVQRANQAAELTSEVSIFVLRQVAPKQFTYVLSL